MNHKVGTIITIDGPAGAGKSSVSKALAAKLGYLFLDTGSMYRAVTLKALRKKLDLNNEDQLVHLVNDTKIVLNSVDGQFQILLDGEDVSEAIRTAEVTANTSFIASKPKVREVIVGWQREFAQKNNVVAEGRDMATVVFPNATYKFYLDADPNERADRRLRELQAKGVHVDPVKMKKDILERDNKDMTREASPLKKADDAILIDSTGLNVEQSAEKILQYIKR